jgi:hypothetical protein
MELIHGLHSGFFMEVKASAINKKDNSVSLIAVINEST